VVLWTTRYQDAAVTELRESGHQVLATDIARLSPLRDKHVNCYLDNGRTISVLGVALS
jgi:hypothetical protein